MVATVEEPKAKKDKLWTVEDVAFFLDVSKKTVWRWKEAGKLPRGKKLVGRTVRWSPEVIRRWVEKQPAA